MACNKGIGIAFSGLGEARHTPKLPQSGKIRLAPGQQLMDIRLMTNIKYQTVLFRVKDGFNGYRQLNNTQVGGNMSAGLGNLFN